ncbi:MAG TPA: hypothetical protein VJT73_07470, partial [Polyangiaceae bacterium]|nr:hypothetical protein [Polyangiaceae bacterium]
MEKTVNVRAFPWGSLEVVPRETVTLLRDARRALHRAVAPERVGRALSELLGQEVRVFASSIDVTLGEPPPLHGASVRLSTADGAVSIQIDAERELARTVVGKIVARPVALSDVRSPLAPEVVGAFSAIVLAT